MAKRSGQKPTYYLDANVLIDLIEHPADQEPARTVASLLDDGDRGRVNLVTSTLTIIEVWKAKRELDKDTLDPEVEKTINNLWHPDSSPIQLVDCSELIVREAQVMLRKGIARGWTKTKGFDAVHLVTAAREKVDEFFTSEHAMYKWGEVLGLPVCPAHRDPEDVAHEAREAAEAAQLQFGIDPPPQS